MSGRGSRRRRRQRRTLRRLYGALRWWVRGVMSLRLYVDDGALFNVGGSKPIMHTPCRRCGRIGKEHWSFRGCWRFKQGGAR